MSSIIGNEETTFSWHMGIVMYNVSPTTVSFNQFNNKLNFTTLQNHLISMFFLLEYVSYIHILPNNDRKLDISLSFKIGHCVIHIYMLCLDFFIFIFIYSTLLSFIEKNGKYAYV